VDTALDAILEIFTWVGLAAGALLALVALIVWVADGTWLPTRGVVDVEDGRTVVRWFDGNGGVNAAIAGHAESERLAGKSMADIWYRHRSQNRFRLTRRSPAVRSVVWLAVGFAALGALSGIGSLVLLFARG
jgi:hypothetical protein